MRVRGAFELLTKLAVAIGRRRIDELRRPERSPAFGSKRPRSDQDGVCEGSQQSHDETIGLVAATDYPAGGRLTVFDCDDAVDRADKIRVNTWLVDGELATVESRQLPGQDVAGGRRALDEQFERLQIAGPRAGSRRQIDVNSVRSCGSCS